MLCWKHIWTLGILLFFTATSEGQVIFFETFASNTGTYMATANDRPLWTPEGGRTPVFGLSGGSFVMAGAEGTQCAGGPGSADNTLEFKPINISAYKCVKVTIKVSFSGTDAFEPASRICNSGGDQLRIDVSTDLDSPPVEDFGGDIERLRNEGTQEIVFEVQGSTLNIFIEGGSQKESEVIKIEEVKVEAVRKRWTLDQDELCYDQIPDDPVDASDATIAVFGDWTLTNGSAITPTNLRPFIGRKIRLLFKPDDPCYVIPSFKEFTIVDCKCMIKDVGLVPVSCTGNDLTFEVNPTPENEEPSSTYIIFADGTRLGERNYGSASRFTQNVAGKTQLIIKIQDKDDAGCELSDTLDVTKACKSCDIAGSFVSVDTESCDGDGGELRFDLTTGTATDYNISWQKDGSAYTGTSLTLGNITSGNYELTLESKADASCKKTFPINFTVTQTKKAISTTGTEICLEDFNKGPTEDVTDGGGVKVLGVWTWSDGSALDSKTVSAGQAVNLLFTPTDVCFETLTKSYTVKTCVCNIAGSFVSVDTESCDGDGGELRFNLTTGTAIDYNISWQKDGSPYTGTSLTLSNITSGNYELTLESKADASCKKSFSINFTVTQTKKAINTTGTEICLEDFNKGPTEDVTDAGGVKVSGVWTWSDGSTLDSKTVSAGQTVNLLFTPTDVCFETLIRSYTVKTCVCNIAGSFVSVDTESCDGDGGELRFDLTTGTATDYNISWQKDGSPYAGTSLTLGNITSGNYELTLESKADASCKKSFSINFTVTQTKNAISTTGTEICLEDFNKGPTEDVTDGSGVKLSGAWTWSDGSTLDSKTVSAGQTVDLLFTPTDVCFETLTKSFTILECSCSITDLQFKCISLDEEYFVFNIDPIGTGVSDKYTLSVDGNEVNRGNFGTNLIDSIKLNVTSSYSFVIQDVNSPDCSLTQTINAGELCWSGCDTIAGPDSTAILCAQNLPDTIKLFNYIRPYAAGDWSYLEVKTDGSLVEVTSSVPKNDLIRDLKKTYLFASKREECRDTARIELALPEKEYLGKSIKVFGCQNEKKEFSLFELIKTNVYSANWEVVTGDGIDLSDPAQFSYTFSNQRAIIRYVREDLICPDARDTVVVELAANNCNGDCDISPELVDPLECNDNGTDKDPKDDFFPFRFQYTASSDSFNLYDVTSDGKRFIGAYKYGEIYSTKLPADGKEHTIRVEDKSTDCIAEFTFDRLLTPCSCAFTVTEALRQNPTCFGASDGLISVNVQDFFGDVTFNWDDGAHEGKDYLNASGGKHLLVAMDTGTGCVDSLEVTLEDPPEISIACQAGITPVDSIPYAVFSVDGYNNNLVYSYSGAVSGNDFFTQNLLDTIFSPLGGRLEIEVQTANGCADTCGVTLPDPPCRLLDSLRVIPSTCEIANGEIHVVGRHPSSEIFWSDGNTLFDRVGVQAGLYSFSISNEKCTLDGAVLVENVGPVAIRLDSIQDPSCFDSADGLISIAPADSISSWTLNGLSQTSPTINASQGAYDILVLDEYGCEHTFKVDIGFDFKPEGLQTDAFAVRPYKDIFDLTAVVDTMTWQSAKFGWRDTTSNWLCEDCLIHRVNVIDTANFEFVISLNENCNYSVLVPVKSLRENFVQFPNVISSNSDGLNDYFTILNPWDKVEEVSSFKIFNRWGDILYQEQRPPISQEIATKFNGQTSQGDSILPGVYIYEVQLLYKNGKRRKYTGELSIVR